MPSISSSLLIYTILVTWSVTTSAPTSLLLDQIRQVAQAALTTSNSSAWLASSTTPRLRLPWSVDASDYPDPTINPAECGRPRPGHVCDPDGYLTVQQADALDNKIADIVARNIRKRRCACGTCSLDNGYYRVSVAIAGRLEGTGRPTERTTLWATNVRLRWGATHGLCRDNSVIGLVTEERQVITATGPRARDRYLRNRCVDYIFGKTRDLFSQQRWFDGLNSMLDYYGRVFDGWNCGRGLTVGAIVGIVFGVISGVAAILALVVCCIGFFQNWECVMGTCIGICIGAIIGFIQAVINAIIMSIFAAMCEACGCDDCHCEPLDCLPDDDGFSAPDGGGAGGGGF